MPSAPVKRSWDQVAALGCCICGGPAEIAHAHGGSIVERMQEPKAKGKKLPRYDWLVLPLCYRHHRDTSVEGLDQNVQRWEAWYGPQADHIDRLMVKLGMNVWALAKVGSKTMPRVCATESTDSGLAGGDAALMKKVIA
jgi:hypothetical protein